MLNIHPFGRIKVTSHSTHVVTKAKSHRVIHKSHELSFGSCEGAIRTDQVSTETHAAMMHTPADKTKCILFYGGLKSMPCDCLFVSLTMLPGLDMILSRGKDACFIGAGKKIVFVIQFYESGRRYSTGVFSIGSLLVLCCL